MGRADPHKHALQSSASGQVPTARAAISTSWLVDDDDWLAPDLFARLREFASVRAGVDGFRWGSVRLGRGQYALDADANFALHPTVTLRPRCVRSEGRGSPALAPKQSSREVRLGSREETRRCRDAAVEQPTKGGPRPGAWRGGC
jgi:hypothetical protein